MRALTDGSCSIQVHLGWLACRHGRRLCSETPRYFEKSGTGSESMWHQARNQKSP